MLASASSDGFPDTAELAAFRAWIEGMDSRVAVDAYLAQRRSAHQSSRALISAIRRRLIAAAQMCQQGDLKAILAAKPRSRLARQVPAAIEALKQCSVAVPGMADPVAQWLPARLANPLQAAGLSSLSSVLLRIVAHRMWWRAVPGLGSAGARRVEAFFAGNPELTLHAAAVAVQPAPMLSPWEALVPPETLDGSQGTFRAPRTTCVLAADNDYQAVQAWLSLQESETTRRAYRKEAERLMLWAIVQQGKALSSLTTEDAIAFRAFLRRPQPRERWVGPVTARTSSYWRPFQGPLSARSLAYALTVIGALFRWLIAQRYMLANPFAGLKVKGVDRRQGLDAGRAFTSHEWSLIRTVADSLELRHGWSDVAAQRLRFVLDFAYATGLRAHELVGATLGQISWDARGDAWLKVVGKGSRTGLVALPPLAQSALDRFLAQRGLPVTRSHWHPKSPLIPGFDADGAGITASRLWKIMKGFFAQAAESLREINPSTADKLLQASPHWMRHTHATHALENGVDLTTVRDNLRHASVSTTSMYLHTDQSKRAKQFRQAFAAAAPRNRG